MTAPLRLDGSFEADYDIVQLVDTPSALGYNFHQPGAVPRPDLLLEVTRPDGSSWTGGLRAGGLSVGSPHTGIHATPAGDRVLVVARGDAYLIDVGRPATYETVAAGGPVVAVKPVARENILLLATPWTVTGIGGDGVLCPRPGAWRSTGSGSMSPGTAWWQGWRIRTTWNPGTS